DDPRPVTLVAGCLPDQFRIEMVPGVTAEMVLEIVRDFGFAFHPQQGFGPARVAAAVFAGRALEQRYARTRLQPRRRSRPTGDAGPPPGNVDGSIGVVHLVRFRSCGDRRLTPDSPHKTSASARLQYAITRPAPPGRAPAAAPGPRSRRSM